MNPIKAIEYEPVVSNQKEIIELYCLCDSK
jgi:hypothetical protein